LGGGTTRIGNLSFRGATHPLLATPKLKGTERIKEVFERPLSFGDGATAAVTVNDAEWLDHLGYIGARYAG
jgi:tyrosyl-tRNA synthetase